MYMLVNTEVNEETNTLEYTPALVSAVSDTRCVQKEQ